MVIPVARTVEGLVLKWPWVTDVLNRLNDLRNGDEQPVCVHGTLYVISQQSVHVVVNYYQFSAFVLFIQGFTRSPVVISQ